MSFSQADYATVLQQCREALRQGNHVMIDPKMVIGCILNAAGAGGMSFEADALCTVLDTQLAILNAFTDEDDAATIVAAIATAATAIGTPQTALVAANPTGLALAASTTMDG